MYKALLRARKEKGRESADIVFADGEDQAYGYVSQLLGNGRVLVLCPDGVSRTGRICGSMRKRRQKSFVERGDVVLCCRRDFDGATVDIVRKYALDDVRVLLRNRLLSDPIVRELTGVGGSGSGRPAADGGASNEEHFGFDDDEGGL